MARRALAAPSGGPLVARPRRWRATGALRALARETRLHPDALVQPLFVVPGRGVEREIPSMPGQYHRSVDRLGSEASALARAGVRGVLLFARPARRSADARAAWEEGGIVPQAVRALRRQVGDDLAVITDVCLCAYLPHGHCGVVRRDHHGRAGVANDESVALLARVAASHAAAGADAVAPSDMMDGRVGAIRAALDGAGFSGTGILSYAVKYASAFYGPFRDAQGSAPGGFDRAGYQMDPANATEALREIALDVAQGADAVMVKPALAYLDILREAAGRVAVPLAAYSVSGEYAMVKAAARAGWLDERRAALEILASIRRAGASIVVTYWAHAAARWLRAGA